MRHRTKKEGKKSEEEVNEMRRSWQRNGRRKKEKEKKKNFNGNGSEPRKRERERERGGKEAGESLKMASLSQVSKVFSSGETES